MTIIINPGSGPVDEATLEFAQAAMDEFALDVKRARGMDVTWSTPKGQKGARGRWPFYLHLGTDWEPAETYHVGMPGLPVAKVRFMGENGQDIWDFPRLYVNGSSWVWLYAIGVCEPGDDVETSEGSDG